MMKAIGGTRRQIRRVYLRTALLLGAVGSRDRRRARRPDRERGRPLLRLELLRDLARLRGRRAGLIASVVVGLLAPPLAALPAIRRGSRIPVREGLEEVPALQGGQAAARPRRCAGSRSCRGRRRSASAASPAAGGAASRRSSQIAPRGRDAARGARARSTASPRPRTPSGTSAHCDIALDTVVGTQLDARADRVIRTTTGCCAGAADAHELASSSRARTPRSTASRERPLFEHADQRRPLVHAAEGGIACPRRGDRREHRAHDRHPRRRHRDAADGAGPDSFRVDRRDVDASGTTAPTSTCRCRRCRQVLGTGTVNGYLDPDRQLADHGAIDRTTTRLEDRLAAAGYGVGTRSSTSASAPTSASNRRLDSAIAVLGLLDRRDQHGRPRQRDHDERARADARDRRPPLHRRPRPRHPPHLHRRRASPSRSPAGCSASPSATRSPACSAGCCWR